MRHQCIIGGSELITNAFNPRLRGLSQSPSISPRGLLGSTSPGLELQVYNPKLVFLFFCLFLMWVQGTRLGSLCLHSKSFVPWAISWSPNFKKRHLFIHECGGQRKDGLWESTPSSQRACPRICIQVLRPCVKHLYQFSFLVALWPTLKVNFSPCIHVAVQASLLSNFQVSLNILDMHQKYFSILKEVPFLLAVTPTLQTPPPITTHTF